MQRTTEIAGLIIVLLFVGAGIAVQQSVRQSEIAQATAAFVSSTPLPLPIGPLVASINPDVVIKEWQYFNPNEQGERGEFQFSPLHPGAEAIKFGVDPETAYIRWRKGGFDFVWFGFSCSTQPVVVIEGTTIGLWTNDHIFELCVAEAVSHAFSVKLDTTIPQEGWQYKMHDGEEVPPVTLQTQP